MDNTAQHRRNINCTPFFLCILIACAAVNTRRLELARRDPTTAEASERSQTRAGLLTPVDRSPVRTQLE